jgi:hypothetical protein
MRVAVGTGAAEDAAVSVAADMQALVAALVGPAWLVATVELESADRLALMLRDLHLESQPDDMAVMVGKGTRREAQLEPTFMVLLQGRKVELRRGSLLVRQSTPVAITPREINLELGGPGDPTSNPVIIREQIGISGSNGWLRQKVQPDQAALGRDRI